MGESGGGRQRWTMAAFGDDVAAVVRHPGLGEVVLIGHSMGGDVVEANEANNTASGICIG